MVSLTPDVHEIPARGFLSLVEVHIMAKPFHKTRARLIKLRETSPFTSIDRIVDTLVKEGHDPATLKEVIHDYYGMSYADLREHCGIMTPTV